MKNNAKYNKFFILVPILIFLTVTGIVMLLWNGLLPEILGVKTISYWQAMGILVLSKILFGGFHCAPGKFRKWKEERIKSRLEGMSEEDKEEFRRKLKERFGGNPFCGK